MSVPNESDPAASLRPEAIDALVADALDAIAAADSTAALKEARMAHAGDRSPLALANRAIGTIPPAERKRAGQLIGAARGRVQQALAARTPWSR